MCGLVGEFNPQQPNAQAVAHACDLLRHRGPDDEGNFHDDRVAFGFRRLAILDLSPAGHQPMQGPEGHTWLMHNGEIYNFLELRSELQGLGYRFHSQSDTEVILAAYSAWGTNCFAKFNGMWAMALWDAKKQQLLLTRDRFGEKPLYYSRDGNRVLFGSEIKAVLALMGKTPQPNDQIVFDYLAYAFHDHTTETFFQNIHHIPPGHVVTISEQGFTDAAYWTLQQNVDRAISFDAASERFLELLNDSIRLRQRSDVPLGTCLSGGLDSSSIAMLVAQQLRQTPNAPRQKTFTACSTDLRYDERRFSDEVNALINAEAHTVFPDPQEFRKVFQKILHHQEEPFLSMSIFAQWKVMETAKKAGVTVLLDGQGGDEVLAGYVPFFASLLADRIRRFSWWDAKKQFHGFLNLHKASLMDILPTLALYLLPQYLGKTVYRFSGRTELSAMQPMFRAKHFRYPTLPKPTNGLLQSHLYRLLTGTGVRALLHYEDRNAMAFSIESRVPFLDHRIAEFTLGLPDTYLLSDGQTKRLMRAAMKNILPQSINNRHDKMGFVVPQAEWFRGPLRTVWESALSAPNACINAYVDPVARQKVIRAFNHGEQRSNGILWRWYNLEQWLGAFYG